MSFESPRRLRNRRERGPAGSIIIGLLIGTFGLTLLANNLGWADAHQFMRQFWPFLLMAAGVGLLFIRTQGQQSASGFWGISLIVGGLWAYAAQRDWIHVSFWAVFGPTLLVLLGGVVRVARLQSPAARTARAGCLHPHVRGHVRQRAASPRRSRSRAPTSAAVMGGVVLDLTAAQMEGDTRDHRCVHGDGRHRDLRAARLERDDQGGGVHGRVRGQAPPRDRAGHEDAHRARLRPHGRHRHQGLTGLAPARHASDHRPPRTADAVPGAVAGVRAAARGGDRGRRRARSRGAAGLRRAARAAARAAVAAVLVSRARAAGGYPRRSRGLRAPGSASASCRWPSGLRQRSAGARLLQHLRGRLRTRNRRAYRSTSLHAVRRRHRPARRRARPLHAGSIRSLAAGGTSCAGAASARARSGIALAARRSSIRIFCSTASTPWPRSSARMRRPRAACAC